MNRAQIQLFNSRVPIRKILVDAGVAQGEQSLIFCPFHPDVITGHKSASIKSDSNVLFCYSERRIYRPFDVLKLAKLDPGSYNMFLDGVSEEGFPESRRLRVPAELKMRVLKGEVELGDIIGHLNMNSVREEVFMIREVFDGPSKSDENMS